MSTSTDRAAYGRGVASGLRDHATLPRANGRTLLLAAKTIDGLAADIDALTADLAAATRRAEIAEQFVEAIRYALRPYDGTCAMDMEGRSTPEVVAEVVDVMNAWDDALAARTESA